MWQKICALTLLGLVIGLSTQTGFGDEGETSSEPGIELVGVLEIAGSSKDKSGLDEVFSVEREESSTGQVAASQPQFSNDMLGGFSALAYTGADNVYYALSDRGPLDGAVDWDCRFQKIRILISENGKQPVKAELLETVLLTDQDGMSFTGLASAFPATQKTSVGINSARAASASRLDPEGIRISAEGNVFVSDEYGPRLIEFSPNGKMVRELRVPEKYLIDNPGLTKSDENPKNLTGRSTNRGMEGLAISSDRTTLFGLMQSPLLQDSLRVQITDKPTGLNCRLWQTSVTGDETKELMYRLENEQNKLNEILAVGDDDFLVIERDGEIGALAKFKRIYLISTKSASDISKIDRLPPIELPKGVQPVSKKLLIDLLDPKWKLAGETMPEKIEGLAFGPDLPDGRQTLLVTSDNDFEPTTPSYFYVFAIPQTFLE